MLLLKKCAPRPDSRLQRRVYALQDSESDDSESESETQYEDAQKEDSSEKIIGKIQQTKPNDELRQYFCARSGKDITKNLSNETNSKNNKKNGKLERQQLDLKKIEYRKKIDIVWNSIISKYSAYDEDDQGDVINLRDLSIEEDKGHIEKLQNFQRTTIWNDINKLESDSLHEDYRRDFDPSQDPINLLNVSRPSTPSQSDLLNSVNKPVPKSSGISTPNRFRRKPTIEVQDENDPFLLLTPKSSKRPTRATSPRRALLSKKVTKPIDLTNDPISMLTPTKASRITTRRASPKRYSRVEPSSPMNFMSSPVVSNGLRRERSDDYDEDRISSPSSPDHGRIDTSPLRSRVERSQSRGRSLRRPSDYIKHSKQKTMGQTGEDQRSQFKVPHGQPIDLLKTRFTPSRSDKSKQQIDHPIDLSRSQLTPNTNTNTPRKPPLHTTDFGNDPICLLTPKSMTRRNSRIPTRSSSPKTKRNRENDDPLVLLTPRSSSKRLRSERTKRSEKSHPFSRPPPMFNLGSNRSTPRQQPPPQEQPPFFHSQSPFIQNPYMPYQPSYSNISTPMRSRHPTPVPNRDPMMFPYPMYPQQIPHQPPMMMNPYMNPYMFMPMIPGMMPMYPSPHGIANGAPHPLSQQYEDGYE